MSRKKHDLQEEDIEFMDLEDEYPEDYEQDGWEDEYPEDYEQDDWEDEYPEDYEQDGWDDEDELEPVKPWVMALVFIGLVVLAAVICAILWRFTHSDVPDSGAAGDGVVAENHEAAGSDEPSTLPDEQAPDHVDDVQGDDGADGGMGQLGDLDTQQPVSTSEAEEPSVVLEPENGDTSMSFNSVEESVTPKDLVNLRTVPSTADENTIVTQISNGDVLSRTGVNPDTGWSRIDYEGQTLYAVTQYLTTDLSYKTPVRPSDPNRVSTISGRVIIFADCDDNVTPKEYVNLRTEPSTTEGDATVRCQVRSGEVVHRTGYSADSGWSRVEYNGEVLYVVTSLMLAQ